MNAKLNAIAHNASRNLESLIRESEREILEAWSAAEAEAQVNETKPKFKLGFAVTLDLDKDEMDSSLSFSVKKTRSCTEKIPDPDQPSLPGTGVES